ncbi:hypothetical protein L2E82_46382 [Cichorium intybus]|uniref:Uncharacterized protein n=1 Tax=Cichorium intybus TaxID=13427 RepID=A0ACB8YTT2_CICIN|nr:hypothetical protein L2E82_46382 [Cichorium intybus]
METCSLNIDFEEYDEVTFSVEGPHNIHLSGFFYGEKQDSDYDHYECDSDMERSVEPEEMNSEDDSDFTDNEMDMMHNSGGIYLIEEIVDDENPATENSTPAKSKKDKQGQIVVKSINNVPELEGEDEDGFPKSSSVKDKASVPVNSEGVTEKWQNSQVKKKKGTDDSEQSAKRKKDDSKTMYLFDSNFSNFRSSRTAATLMGCNVKDLISALSTNKNHQQAIDTRDALMKFVYTCVFSWVVETINKSLKGDNVRSISILDIYGFESFQNNSFDKLLINYADESLQ